jgi:hypothetical protein
MMQVQRVEELVYGEKVDIVKHDQEGSCIRPEDDKDRYDRVSSRGSRLLSTNGMCPFNLSSEPPIRARNLDRFGGETFRNRSSGCIRVGKWTQMIVPRQ